MPSKKPGPKIKPVLYKPKQSTQKPNSVSKSKLLFRFKITLLEIKPPIWRRIELQDCSLGDLHKFIQAALGWENEHMHQFFVDGARYGIPDPELGIKNEAKVRLSQIAQQGGKGFRFRYEYDFGDSWMHDVVFESSSPNDLGQNFPVCLDGSRACPPEDCGGPWSYEDFLEAIADPRHERHADLMEWIGGEFDPEAFDAKTTTKAMMKAVRKLR
jgi:hypothetical protein